jgi:membrane dipeptidase
MMKNGPALNKSLNSKHMKSRKMKNRITKAVIATISLGLMFTPLVVSADQTEIQKKAEKLAHEYLIVDTHIDVPYRIEEEWEDVTKATAKGDFDYPRAMKGGLNVPFMSIYTPSSLEGPDGDGSKNYQVANRLIDSVEALVTRAPDKFMLVRNTSEAEEALKKGKIGLAMGMENGSPINNELKNVQFFADRGISYITLAHGLSNHISDSSYDENRQWNGLSAFGMELVAEMNRVGVMVDVSHISDQAFYQVMDISKTPVIASHSSPRHFTPGFERNMSDDMIKALAKKGGVIQINFGSAFVSGASNDWYDAFRAKRSAFMAANSVEEDSDEVKKFSEEYLETNPMRFATMDELMANFQHVIDLVGPEYVGIGSDYDGVGDSLPEGMKDVSAFPALITEMLKREYTDEVIRGILGGNVMRVWSQVEDYASKAKAK